MGIKLVGKRQTKRTEFFLKAAEKLQVPVSFVDWEDVGQEDFYGDVVKLDPFAYETANLFEMNGQIGRFQAEMNRLASGACGTCRFLNPPAAIERVLNKRTCKEILQKNRIPVTEMFPEVVQTVEQLEEAMERHRTFSVFIKPVFCSGAAGVTAFRLTLGRGTDLTQRAASGRSNMTAYTSCVLQGDELVNTKRLRRLEEPGEIYPLLNAVLSLGAVVERWHPKASFEGKSYDLRVVWQFGEIAFVVARQSKGPVTNLHLNNAALEIGRLGLPGTVMRELEEICGRTMECFPDLHMAGIDVLLEKDSLRPYIIEVNGQGDLMYQDIFCENRIYTKQIKWMAEQASKAL